MATYTRQNTRITRWLTDVVYASDGSASSANTSVQMVARLVNDSDSTDVVVRQADNVYFDLLDASIATTTITAAGKTVSYQQLAALLRQAALDRANSAGIS